MTSAADALEAVKRMVFGHGFSTDGCMCLMLKYQYFLRVVIYHA